MTVIKTIIELAQLTTESPLPALEPAAQVLHVQSDVDLCAEFS